MSEPVKRAMVSSNGQAGAAFVTAPKTALERGECIPEFLHRTLDVPRPEAQALMERMVEAGIYLPRDGSRSHQPAITRETWEAGRGAVSSSRPASREASRPAPPRQRSRGRSRGEVEPRADPRGGNGDSWCV